MVIDDALREIAAGSGAVALVTLARTLGSTPREAGSRMAVRPDGSIVGTVGGGKPEGQARAAALELLAAKQSEGADGKARCAKLRVEMTGMDAKGVELICGGVADLWVEVVDERARSIYKAALAAIDGGERPVILSSADEGTLGLAPSDIASAWRAAKGALCGISEEDGLFYSPLEASERLLILGGGHVGRAMAEVASRLSFLVQVADPRPEYSGPGRFPSSVASATVDFSAAIEAFPQGQSSYVVVVSPGHLGDLECARSLVRRDYRYVGIIGSRRKCRMLIDTLIAEGVAKERAESLSMPIGLDIGALTPEEIAIAIAAELIATRHDSPALAWIDSDRRRRRDAASRDAASRDAASRDSISRK